MTAFNLPSGPCVHAHRMVVETARSMAHEVYDLCMRRNDVWARWKQMCPELTPELSEALFVDHLYPHLIEDARATLAGVLATNISDDLREAISDAIIADTGLREGRRRARQSVRSTAPAFFTRDGRIVR